MSGYDSTLNYNLKKPWVDADFDAWGDHWNQNADAIDNLFQTMSNKCVVGPGPTSPGRGELWWDSVGGQLYVEYDDGNSVQYVSANSVIGLPITGGELTGPLLLYGNATQPLEAVPLQQLNASLATAGTGVFLPLVGGTVTGQTIFSAPFNGVVINNSLSVGTAISTVGLTVSGPTLTLGSTTATTAEQIFLRSQTPQARYVSSFTGGFRRWDVGTDSTAETSEQAGSNFVINAYNDAGTYVGAILQGVRGSGQDGNGPPYIGNLRPFQMSQVRATIPGGVVGNDMSFPAAGADVQPVSTLPANPLATTSGSGVVSITWPGCGAAGGVFSTTAGEAFVNLLGVAAVGGITPTGWLKGTRVDNNTFSITWTANATGTATGGGSVVTVQPNFTTITEKGYSVLTGGTQGFPVQYERLFVANPAFYKQQGGPAGSGPQFQQEFRQVYGPPDPSGANNWGIIGTELDLINRGKDPGYAPNLFGAANPSIGMWSGAFDGIPAFATGGGTTANWNTVFSIFAFGKIANYVGYSVQPNALVGAGRDTVTAHGGVAFVAFGSYMPVSANGFAVTNGSSVVTVSPLTAAPLGLAANGDTIYINAVQTVRGVTFGGGSYTIANLTATTFQITGTGSAISTGPGGAATWIALASLEPFAPAEYQGSWKHGITTTNFRSADGSIINTQPGNGIVWNDGTGAASITGVEVSPGNINVVITPGGNGRVIMGTPAFQRIAFNGTVAGNGADLTEDTLMTLTVPASTLVNVGDTLRIAAGGSMGATSDNKTARIRVGGLTFSINTSSAAATKWSIEVLITKTGANTQSYMTIGGLLAATGSGIASGTGTFTDTSAQTLTISGQNITNSVANSITCQYASCDFIRGT